MTNLLSCWNFSFFFGITFFEDEDDSPYKDGAIPSTGRRWFRNLVSNSQHVVDSKDFHQWTVLVQGLGQPATDRAMPQAGISMLWCCRRFVACHQPPSCFFLRESLFLQIWRLSFREKFPSAKLRFSNATTRDLCETARHLASPWPPSLPRCSPATPGLHVVFWIRSYLILRCFR